MTKNPKNNHILKENNNWDSKSKGWRLDFRGPNLF